MRWDEIGIENILTGKDSQDVSFLESFLNDYSEAFSVTDLCASCHNKIRDYYEQYFNKFYKMENLSGYKLQPQYQNIPCGFDGGYVNDSNITLETAKKLIEFYGIEIFESIPETKEVVEKNSKK